MTATQKPLKDFSQAEALIARTFPKYAYHCQSYIKTLRRDPYGMTREEIIPTAIQFFDTDGRNIGTFIPGITDFKSSGVYLHTEESFLRSCTYGPEGRPYEIGDLSTPTHRRGNATTEATK